jgi:hypothetical protein
MKRIILSVMVLAFAVAVQASDAKSAQTTDKEKPACCGGKVKTSNEAKGTCPFAKSECCSQTAAKKAPVKQTALTSPKATSDSVK